jgi:hypothetical protein
METNSPAYPRMNLFDTDFAHKFRSFFRGNDFSQCMNVALLSLYVTFSPTYKKTWTSFSREDLYDITNFPKLAIPSTMMIWYEFLPFGYGVVVEVKTFMHYFNTYFHLAYSTSRWVFFF